MLVTVLFFGASSSQAVHPERMSPEDLQAAAVNRVLASARELVLASSKGGGNIAQSRTSLAVAKEKLDKKDLSAALAAAYQGVLSVAQPRSRLQTNLRDGFDFLTAACAAEQSGIDTRQAQDIFEAAAGEMGARDAAFASSWETLEASVRRADPATVQRLASVLKALHAPQRAIEIAGGA